MRKVFLPNRIADESCLIGDPALVFQYPVRTKQTSMMETAHSVSAEVLCRDWERVLSHELLSLSTRFRYRDIFRNMP